MDQVLTHPSRSLSFAFSYTHSRVFSSSHRTVVDFLEAYHFLPRYCCQLLEESLSFGVATVAFAATGVAFRVSSCASAAVQA